MTARRLAVALPLLAATVLTGCGADDSADTSAQSSTTTKSSTSAPATPTAVTEAVALPPAPATPASWPAEVEYPVEGPSWVVYVAVAKDDSQAEQDRVWAAMEELRGSTPYVSARGAAAVDCEVGAADALGLDPQALAAPVFLASEADAQQFAAKWGRPVVGPARITENCIA